MCYARHKVGYVAAQLARLVDPPCASGNYLARVIAKLEALPPGTMQMLSTNHLGQAWVANWARVLNLQHFLS